MTGYFQLWPFFSPNKTAAEVIAMVAPLNDKLDSLGIAYTSTTTEFDNFKDAFFGLFDPISTGGLQFGGRLIPSSVLDDNASGFSDAMKHIVAGGGAIIEAGMAPTLDISGNPGNSVLPAWRDSTMYLIPAAPWNDTAGAWEQNLAYRKIVTNDWDAKLTELAPNSGAYMSEADADNPNWKVDWYGANYKKLLAIKKKYDPAQFFYAPKAVGSDYWTVATSGKMCLT